MMGGLLAEDLANATGRARARATGGYPPASVTGHFLAPLKRVYWAMDTVSDAVRTQPQTALSPACTPGCFACCRLYVEVGPWEAFGIADYVTQACEAGVVPREAVLGRLHEEVTRFVASGGDNGAPRLCAFLSRDGHCGIYPARPASCRSYYSRSRVDCERYFGQPDLGETTHPSVVRTPTQGFTAQLSVAETLATAQPPFPPDAAPPVL
jgi:Fe-S-cluster containining protein